MNYPFKPNISVVIPIYNQELFLEKCINSILFQNYQSYEIILIDDGSTDSSSFIAQRFSDIYSHIKYFQYPNSGQGVARNHGISHSIGKYLIFIDCDDCILDGLFLRLEKVMDDDFDFINYGLSFVSNNKVVKNFSTKNYFVLKQDDIFKKSLLDDQIITSPCNKAFKRDFLLHHAIIFPNLRKYEDVFFTRCAAFHAKNIAFIEGTYYIATVREGSNMRSFDNNAIEQLINLFAYEDEFFLPKLKSRSLFQIYQLHKIKLCLFLMNSAAYRSASCAEFVELSKKFFNLINNIRGVSKISILNLKFKIIIAYLLIRKPFFYYKLISLMKYIKKTPY